MILEEEPYGSRTLGASHQMWGLHFAGMMAQCSDCDTTYRVTNRDELDAWAREHWLLEYPWAERVRVVHVID